MRRGAWALAVALCACGAPGTPAPLRSPLAVDVPPSEIGARIARFAPRRMELLSVPGVSIAVVRDGEVAWVGGFGVANAWTRVPVTTETVFEVASISKVVAAYAALRLVESGRLELDRSLNDYLDSPFLPPSPLRDAVTLRTVLTHTSGLSNLFVGLCTDTRIWLPPGRRFSYSGHGFGYLERVIETVASRPFQDHVSEAVLAELGMHSSGYALRGELRERSAYPHVPAWLVLSPFGIGFALCLLLLAACRGLVRALRARAPRAGSLGPAALAASLAAGTIAAVGLLGFDDLPGLLPPLGLIAAFVLLAALLERSIARAVRRPPGSSPRRAAATLALSAIALVWLVARPAVPLPRREIEFRAAGGLHSTARDVGRLLIELMDPAGIGPALAARMLRPQVRVGPRLSWGLGIGIQHGDDGDSVWHWGLNPGEESLFVAHPDQRIGAVVLTNGGPSLAGLRLAREILHVAIGGEHFGYWEEVPGTFLPAREGTAASSP